MTDVTLHFRGQITARNCAVCGARLDRSDLDHWWLRNTWTSEVRNYHEGGGTWPTDWLKPCGVLPADWALRGLLGAASGWIVKALKVLDTVDPDDTDEAERLAALVKAGEVLALATLARSKTPNAEVTGRPARAGPVD